MDDFSFDSFNEFFPDDSNELKWSERDWVKYVRKSDSEISRFASAYSINRAAGKSLEDIALMTGWPINQGEEEPYGSQDDSEDAEFSYEPWTLLNHPIFIISKALFKCMDEHMGRLLDEAPLSTHETWALAKSISEATNFVSLAVNSTDLGEDALARCHYKMGAAAFNTLLAKVNSIPAPKSKEGDERLVRVRNIIFDLRQLCLNLSDNSVSDRQG